MKSMIRLGPSGIEYLTHAWNFYSGCRHKQQGKCPPFPCWAEQLVKRHSNHYPNGFEPTFYPEAFLSPLHLKKPARIGVCFMGDLFGDWVDPHQIVHPEDAYRPNRYTSEARNWSLDILIKQIITDCPQHTFIFLTKNPAGLKAWSPFPQNCWVGVTACNVDMFDEALTHLSEIEAKVKFLSVEPFLGEIPARYLVPDLVDWLIIGAQTKPTVMPKVEWVEDIVDAADKAGIPVFLKNNLMDAIPACTVPFWGPDENACPLMRYRQEMPDRRVAV